MTRYPRSPPTIPPLSSLGVSWLESSGTTAQRLSAPRHMRSNAGYTRGPIYDVHQPGGYKRDQRSLQTDAAVEVLSLANNIARHVGPQRANLETNTVDGILMLMGVDCDQGDRASQPCDRVTVYIPYGEECRRIRRSARPSIRRITATEDGGTATHIGEWYGGALYGPDVYILRCKQCDLHACRK